MLKDKAIYVLVTEPISQSPENCNIAVSEGLLFVDCGSLKGNGTVRRCGIVGVDVVLLEEVCHYGGKL